MRLRQYSGHGPEMLARQQVLLLSGADQTSNRPSLEEQVRTLDTHSPVEVRFVDGSKLRGWIGEVSGTASY